MQPLVNSFLSSLWEPRDPPSLLWGMMAQGCERAYACFFCPRINQPAGEPPLAKCIWPSCLFKEKSAPHQNGRKLSLGPLIVRRHRQPRCHTTAVPLSNCIKLELLTICRIWWSKNRSSNQACKKKKQQPRYVVTLLRFLAAKGGKKDDAPI